MLLDTSGLLCYLYKSEQQHQKAVKLFQSKRGQLLSHSHVLSELIALASIRRLSRDRAIQLVIDLVDSPDVEIIWVDELLHKRAVQLLIEREDKTYSLCDAISFLIMKQWGLSEALTTDRHFEQEGFIRLLPPATQ